MYHTLEETLGCHVELLRYHDKLDHQKIEKYLSNKDLLILDWELSGTNCKDTLELISQVIKTSIPFICIYTNRSDLDNICKNICDYFSGESNQSVTEIAEKFEDAGILQEDYKPLLEKLFSGQGDIMRQLKDLPDYVDHEAIEKLNYRKKDSWLPLWLYWNNAILPNEKLDIAKNVGSNTIIINGKVIICFSKEEVQSISSVRIRDLIPTFAKHITQQPNSVFDIIWLKYCTSLRKALERRADLFNGVSSNALKYLSQSLLEEDSDAFSNSMKELFRDEIMDLFDTMTTVLPDEIIEEIKTTPVNSPNPTELVKLNERLNMNHMYSKTPHNIDFGDIFISPAHKDDLSKYENDSAKEEHKNIFWLCVSAKCDCLRPDKISYNYLFLRTDNIFTDRAAVKNAESKFCSYVQYNEDIISIVWETAVESVYFSPDQIFLNVSTSPVTITGNNRGRNYDLTYLGNLKENYTQRLANQSFSYNNRVGITLAQIPSEKEAEKN